MQQINTICNKRWNKKRLYNSKTFQLLTNKAPNVDGDDVNLKIMFIIFKSIQVFRWTFWSEVYIVMQHLIIDKCHRSDFSVIVRSSDASAHLSIVSTDLLLLDILFCSCHICENQLFLWILNSIHKNSFWILLIALMLTLGPDSVSLVD